MSGAGRGQYAERLTTDRSRGRFYFRELDGLRFFAFLAVFLHHAIGGRLPAGGGLSWHDLRWWTSGAALAGGFGVDLFFVLSSFLITSLLLREADRRGRIDVPAFWMRRILRIWPLYFAFVLACWIALGLPARVVGAFAVFAGNWAILAWPLPDRAVIAPLWSISVEEQFYLVWPLLLATVPRRWLPSVCFGMVAVSLAWRAAIIAGGGGIERIWLNTMARLDPIAIGALIALAARTGRIRIGSGVKSALAIGAPLVVIAATSLLWQDLLRPSAGPTLRLVVREGVTAAAAADLVFSAVALACGGMLVAALAAPGSWLGHPVLVYLGRISYGLYVFHFAAIRLVEPLPEPLGCVVSFAITVGAAAVSYRVLEEPFLSLKERFTHVRSGLPPAPTAVAAAVGAVPPADALSK